MASIILNGQAIRYSVRSSRRAKRISIRYSPSDGLEVVYPVGPHQPTPEELLRRQADWILATRDKIRSASETRPQREYRDGEAFLFRGAAYRLLLEKDSSASRIGAHIKGDRLALSLPDTDPDAEESVIRGAIEGFYRAQAKAYLPRRLDELATKHGFHYEQLRIKNQKTRWGSCSAKRNINLNLRLMMAPDDAIDYIIIHELCHLRELNHNRAFWELVESYCPAYRYWDAWFKQHGPSLIL